MDNTRKRVIWAVLLGLVLFILGAGVAVLGVIMGLVVFNGCMGNNGAFKDTIGLTYLLGCWPLTVLATAIVPAIFVGRGRWKVAIIAFFIGLLSMITVLFGWLPVGSWTMG
jgi:hypothetical protein